MIYQCECGTPCISLVDLEIHAKTKGHMDMKVTIWENKDFEKARKEAAYSIQGLVEQGIIQYKTNENGEQFIVKGINFGKNLGLPKTIAGKKMKWI